MITDTYLNSIPKGCQTCRFKNWSSLGPEFWTCGKYGGNYCSISLRQCNKFEGWSPAHPRRSIRQWLVDTFIA